MTTVLASTDPKIEINQTKVKLNNLFTYLNKLITQFNSLGKNSFNKETIDLNQVLKPTAQELNIEMEALRDIKNLPKGVKTFNIAVGEQLKDSKKYPAVDHNLSNHRAVAKLLQQIAA